MPRWKSLAAGGLAALAATHAAAQPVAPPDPPFALVPAEDRLTLLGVFMDADILVKLIMAGLFLAALAGLVLWITQAVRPGAGLSRAMAYLSALSAGGVLIGLFGAAYTLMNSMLALSNVRPAPSISVVAPGLAESLLSVMLSLLAAAIATLGHRHLKAKLAGAIEVTPTAEAAAPPTPRMVRHAG